MKTWSRLPSLAASGVALAVIVGACSSGNPGGTFASTVPSPTATVVAEQEREPEAPVDAQVPTATPAPDRAAGGIEVVPVSIDQINVTSVVPAGWEAGLGGTFEGDGGELVFDVEAAADLHEITELGFEPVVQREADGRTWEVFSLDVPGLVIYVAGTEVGAYVYTIVLQVGAELADDHLASVLFPAIDAFEAGELPELSMTLAGAPADADLQALADQVVADSDLPALGITVFDTTEILESAVSGVRRAGDATPVELTDQFSIGSNAKAMTATLVATFVDEGLLGWDTTVAEIHEDLPGLDETMGQVTMRQLLSHTSGLDDQLAGLDGYILGEVTDDRPLPEQRRNIAADALSKPPQQPVGLHLYSNIGYTIVGSLLEELTGTPYEELMETRIFEPLGMDSCGFFAPGTPGQLDQPWGHLDQRGGEPVDPGGPDGEMGHAFSPAGLVHCSMADWVRFLQSQLRGFQGSENEIVSPEAFETLRTPAPDTGYALGWGVIVQSDGSAVLTHTGSNLRFTADVWLISEEGRGFVTVTNIGVGLAAELLGQVTEAIFARYGT